MPKLSPHSLTRAVTGITVVQDTGPIRKDFAQRLYHAMNARGMNQSQLAAEIWGTKETEQNGTIYTVSKNRERISVYLKGRGLPTQENLERMANALGVKPADLSPPYAARPAGPAVSGFTLRLTENGFAVLEVNTVLPAEVALKIATLIQEARSAAAPTPQKPA